MMSTPEDTLLSRPVENIALKSRSDQSDDAKSPPARDSWGSGLEFLMSCIGMSVGLGNIWMFPFRAYENGGGAFIIPYVIVLVVIGKPMYFLELILGQFSSKGPIKVYDFSPAMRGVGAGQTVSILIVMTFYSSVMATILFYMVMSFMPVLPWTQCDPTWSKYCYPAGEAFNRSIMLNSTEAMSSAQLYFTETVMHEIPDLKQGIGSPSLNLAVCLFVSWFVILLVLLKGIKTSGKASYFVAMFPYVILLILLGKALTLPGAVSGMVYFIKPSFSRIWDPLVWYAAVTQCFYALNIGFGCTIMYSSFNSFRHNIYRDTMIITTLDLIASLLAGFTIFGILGYLAEMTGRRIDEVVHGGPGLTFQSYPEAISQFKDLPQLFGVLFFLMFFILSIGSIVAMVSSGITVIRDKFPKVKHWQAVSSVCIFGFLVSLIYITPGGQHLITLVSYHGGDFIVFILGMAQFIAVCWIYGMRRFCDDIEFMLKRKVGLYWRICWSTLGPLILIVILIYTLINLQSLSGDIYPTSAITCGWMVTALGVVQLPAFATFAFWRRRAFGVSEMFKGAFRPTENWGPVDPQLKDEWFQFRDNKDMSRRNNSRSKSEIHLINKMKMFFHKLLGY